MHVVTLVGARPQFVKASMVTRALAEGGIKESIIHSGQHYDHKVSQIFFDELGIPKPDLNLNVGSGSHAAQTSQIMVRLEEFLSEAGPFDFLLLFGDTNTTLAGALVAVKMGIPIAHVEAGLRSFNRAMPEEINRIVTDRLSTLLFCPTSTSVQNLKNEGIQEGVHLVGDVMYDATVHFAEVAQQRYGEEAHSGFGKGQYFLATVHRAANTDDPQKLDSILKGFSMLDAPIVFPAHPRTRPRLEKLSIPRNVHIMEPIGYLQMLNSIKQAKAIITDSGGVQKEAFWLKVPCITLREETEWTETLEENWNQLVGVDPMKLIRAVKNIPGPGDSQPEFGRSGENTLASFAIVDRLQSYLQHNFKSI